MAKFGERTTQLEQQRELVSRREIELRDRLADLEPACLASMHGSSVQGGCGKVLREIAAGLATIAKARD